MHERSLVRALLRQALGIMAQQGASRALAIRLSVGEFSGVEPELLRTAYDEMVQDTALCGAELTVEQIPLTAACEQCGCEFPVKRFRFECPACRSRQVSIRRGDELLLDTITLECVES